ncbi:uncharacterized protein LOC127264420 [Andrographis paniculata]|uniref:uncharacterized protein LOC127264420 n=1 Tax=Andrographis paniculata TaxID=175694 RepID=UPI0021E91F8A|nr:uncharacterized protein LOC127264420 [Andrographis paniculata]XP_051149906.1 uncharacterized protein LOC127264420 [Andrographis paniculata]
MFDPRFQDHHGGCGEEDRNINRNTRLDQIDGTCSSSRRNWCGDQDVVQFRATPDEDDDSGFCSPPLWENNSTSQHKTTSQPLLTHHVYTSLSPSSPKSRLQAITRGQRELMEMVKNLPESSYELSLKDLVEHRQMEPPPQASADRFNNNGSRGKGGGVKLVKRQGSKTTTIRRSASFEIENKGLFLKIPFSLQSKKRDRFPGNGSGKVSPKPEAAERDWWKKKFTGSSDESTNSNSNSSSSRRTSNNSGSNGSGSTNTTRTTTRLKDGFLSSCLPFFHCRRSRHVD